MNFVHTHPIHSHHHKLYLRKQMDHLEKVTVHSIWISQARLKFGTFRFGKELLNVELWREKIRKALLEFEVSAEKAGINHRSLAFKVSSILILFVILFTL
jgi:hypothetical protein